MANIVFNMLTGVRYHDVIRPFYAVECSVLIGQKVRLQVYINAQIHDTNKRITKMLFI